MTTPPEYEIYALRYATNQNQRAAHNFIDGDAHDQPMPLDYFIWVIRNADRCFVVDTGFDAEAAQQRGRQLLSSPVDLLAALGIDAAAVKDVIITHLHYDHAGNRELFPQARFHLQDREMAFATGRCMCHQGLRASFDGRDVSRMVERLFAGQVIFHDGDADIAPGISVHRVGGHTDGLQIVRVWSRRGWVVLASDASHFYANMEQGRSFPIVYHLGDMYEGHRRCYALASTPGNVIPGHDPLVRTRYPAVALDGAIVRLD